MLLVLPGASAEEICKRYEPSEEVLTLLKPEDRPSEFIEKLATADLIDDALTFLANALPRREAAWWTVQVARSVSQEAPPKVRAAFVAAEAWVISPTDANRRKAFDLGQVAGFDTPAGLAATAVFWSSGSMAPADVQEVPPPPDLMAKAIVGVILLVAALGPPIKIPEAKRESLDLGLRISERLDRWKS